MKPRSETEKLRAEAETQADSRPVGPASGCRSCGKSVARGEDYCPACMRTLTAGASDPGQTRSGPRRVASYRIVSELGAGGMGTVFEAYDEKMERPVALKLLSRQVAASGKAALRFEQEAWIAGKLNHPNLVKVYERGHWDEFSYYAMELVRGGSLHDVISNMKSRGRDDRWDLVFGSRAYIHWALSQIVAAAHGLDYAHRQGVVHRDIKPMNLLLSRELDQVKIADFGLAIEADTTRLTTEGSLLGTLLYMAPEQILGKQDQIDARTDVYALGVTLFELITLALPYSGKTQQMYMDAVLTKEAQRARKLNELVSRDLETVIRKALEKDPKDRYSSAAAFAEDLENVLHLRPIRAQPPGPALRLWKWVRRKPVHAALIGALILGVPTLGILTQRAIQHRQLQQELAIEELRGEVRQARQRDDDHGVIDGTTRILGLDPEDDQALLDRSLAHMRLARGTGGSAAAERSERFALSDASRLIELLPERSWPRRVEIFILGELGRHAEAERAEATLSGEAPAERLDEDIYFDGVLALEAGTYQQAAELFSELILRRPAVADAYVLRAGAYEGLGHDDQAEQDYRFAAVLEPNDFFPVYRLGNLKMAGGDHEDADAHFRRALELDPTQAHVFEMVADNHSVMGRLAAQSGDLEAVLRHFAEAERAAREGLALNPGLPWLHVNLGASLMEQHRLLGDGEAARVAEAIEHYRETIALAGQAASSSDAAAVTAALHNLCDALIQSGDLGQALEGCRQGVQLQPEDAVNHYNLAAVYALLRRPDDAFPALERDFELGDNDWAYLESDPWFDSLHDDPRFANLIGRMQAAAE